MIDAVLSYHTNPHTCGVAKFGYQLAKRLGVFFGGVNQRRGGYPLFSLKCAEIPQQLWGLCEPYDLFLHDSPVTHRDWDFVMSASRVYAANPSIAEDISHRREDVQALFCPSMVDGNPHRGAYKVLTFGMAHKLVLPHFRKLKEDLDRDHPDYTLSLSTAVHEGSPWDEALYDAVESMQAIFGDKLRVLGFLADDALAKELQECDAVAAFFVPALRANNTSAWAALAAGKFLYTNLDSQSPALDPQQYGWDALLEKLTA